MANFKPLKIYMLRLINELADEYALSDPFLDAGCGTGDLALHFAKKGWAGKAIDSMPEAVLEAAGRLSPYKNSVTVEHADIFKAEGRYKTIFLCDVLEHIEDDEALIKKIKDNMREGSHIVISVPVFRSEWRWDDEFYGHVRRYEIRELTEMLSNNGFTILAIWDFTFPFFWLLRRIYTRVFPEKTILNASRQERTGKSSLHSSWDKGILTALVEKLVWWRPLFYLQSKFKERLAGCECIIVARLGN